jgi:hypothetical protein
MRSHSEILREIAINSNCFPLVVMSLDVTLKVNVTDEMIEAINNLNQEVRS